ncbi:MAG: DUF2075 domain-containing protein [Veillonellaceae bacterium]|nr:DUF2075 domain-containing protein [Veillonellaceae bacterium]
MTRYYYSASIGIFLAQTENEILGELSRNNQYGLDDTQKNAWLYQIRLLRTQLSSFSEGSIIFEYTIPRVGKRLDNIFITNGLVFLLEFKVGDSVYHNYAVEQVMDYALDLKNFHKESHDKIIIPIVVATRAERKENYISQYSDGIIKPMFSNGDDLSEIIQNVCCLYKDKAIAIEQWENSIYMPTPTIIEAAQALYRGHSVTDISRSDSGHLNLSKTTDAITKVIEKAKQNKEKAICFITGVPGAGKTLAGLNIANERHRFDEEEHAVFLSGNGPLVDVLQEALARNQVDNSIEKIKKSEALMKAKAFIQLIHHFRDDALSVDTPPIEKVVIFDEAQRAWTLEQTSSFMQKKKGKPDFNMSEPEFLISVMDRHQDWAVIICLIGGGQEINTGEAGLPEWFDALRRCFTHWHVYISNKITDVEYTHNNDLKAMLSDLECEPLEELHLSVSLRSFRSGHVSELVKAILDVNQEKAKQLYSTLNERYPITITRDITQAKAWIKEKARGSERYGVVASSGSMRLKPFGIWTQCKIEAKNWFLNGKDDIRSSYFLEDAATEFDIQGLELDWALVAWDADFRFIDGAFQYYNFVGAKWNKINKAENVLYRKNAYRVLLTRARQGMVIFIPHGDENDKSREPHFYDGTYDYLKSIGINEI